MMSKCYKGFLFLVVFGILAPLATIYCAAQQNTNPAPKNYLKAQVIREVRQEANPYSMYNQVFQVVFVELLEGPSAGKAVEVKYDTKQLDKLKLKPGEIVILEETIQDAAENNYVVFDKYRLTGSTFLIVLFLLIIVIFVGWKGVGSIVGLLMSIGVLFFFIIPQIISGKDPLFIITIGSVAILLVTTYVAHGFSKQTTIALLSTFIALLITLFIAIITSHISGLTGFADENAFLLHFGSNQTIDIHGLLLGGIILGSVGALNDVTTTQAATVFALYKKSHSQTFSELVKEGLYIGKEHVVSIINTLVLAYAGSSLIVFIFIFSNAQYYPIWVILNSEFLNEELVRTIASTLGILLVVPIVTLLTAWYLCHYKK